MQALRQLVWIQELAAAADADPFIGAVLLGSFARGDADELSDVDFIVFAAEDEFDGAWEARHRLHPADAWCWDYPRPPDGREVAGHRWLTADFVLFDGLIATPSGTRVADPMRVIAGGHTLEHRIIKRDAMTAGKQESREDELVLHPVEQLYGELKLALRAHRRAKS